MLSGGTRLILLVLVTLEVLSDPITMTPWVAYRLMVAQRNREWIAQHNSKQGKAFTMKDYSEFIEYTFEELSEKILMRMPKGKQSDPGKNMQVLAPSPRPSSPGLFSYFPTARYRNVNWTERGMVSQVKEQGACGSCYAFAAIADVQSSYLMKGRKVDLSQQQIVDCSSSFGNEGCNGGWMSSVFAFAMIKGLTLQEKYPYRNQTFVWGKEGGCQSRRGEFKIRGYSYTSMREYDCESLVGIVEKRPVTVAIAADPNFMYYWDGVLDQCGESQLNHAVLVTGVYQDEKTSFWMVKNSWGKWWGMQGFINIDRFGRYGNLCEICYGPSYSIV